MASFHSRGHANGSTTSFASSNLSSQSGRYGSSSTMRSDYSGDSQQPLFPPLPPTMSPPPPPDLPRAEQSIMNIRAGEESSLYQICMNLRIRLATVPGFEGHIAEMEEEEAETADSIDPVTLMWNSLRRGYPLMTVYNALRPAKPLIVDSSRVKEKDLPKAATFKFLQACMSELKFGAGECFLITDLYGEDTTGFVKVTKVVNKVLDILKDRRLLHYKGPARSVPSEAIPSTRSGRQHVIAEIVKTERDYVQHLEMLQQFQNGVQTSGAVPGDAVHEIFLNLNALLDFQRRFLIRIEQQNSLSESEQNWGKLFSHYKDSFRVYEPFIANQSRGNKAVVARWKELQKATVSPELQGMLEAPSVLLGFLVKPFQRLARYPLLLDELRKKGDYDEEHLADLAEGWAAAASILDRANEAVGREARVEAVSELSSRVADWKGHKIDHFGELVLYGTYTVVKGEGAKEVEREYNVYLFERILLCCKEINPNKPKNKMLGSNKPLVDKKGKPKLELKGRIFMQNVTDVVTLKRADQQSYTIQIFWKGDPGVENFVIRFQDEGTMRKWQEAVQLQKKTLTEMARSSGQTGTSATEFAYLKTQPSVENPYREEDDDYDDDTQSSHVSVQGKSQFAVSRNPSSNSLGSIAGQSGRMGPPKYPLQEHGNGSFTPALSLNTNVPPGGLSPGEFPGNSYFSPSNDSPISMRSSSQQGMYAFPRNQIAGGGWTHEGNKHQTAPVMTRAPSRDGTGPPNSYILNGRTVTRPSLPAMAASQYPQQQHLAAAQNRLRSASTPDICNPNVPGARRPGNSQVQASAENVPVPPIPAHMRPPINRSQTTSPVEGQLPIRSANQTSSVQRDRQNRQYPDNYPNYDRPSQRMPPTSDPYPDTPIQLIQSSSMSSSEHESEIGIPYPSQLKVTIWFDPSPSRVTIVVPIIIKHRSLIDRIDSKMVKVSSASIAKGTARLRYKDSDDDIVTIRSDEDVHLAIEDWGMANEDQIREGLVPDFQLYWQQN